MIKVKIDKQAQAAYVYFTEDYDGPVKSRPVDQDIVIDFTEDGKIFGIEILDLTLLSDEIKSFYNINE